MNITVNAPRLLRNLAFLALLLSAAFPLQAQGNLKFYISDFFSDPFDTAPVTKVDASGDPYALIKVTSPNPDEDLSKYVFNFGQLMHTAEKHGNELWIYVQRNAKAVKINRPGYVFVDKDQHTVSKALDLGETLQGGKTYRMTITSDMPTTYTQMVQFVVKPANLANAAVILTDSKGERSTLSLGSDGTAAKALPYGKYSYEVMADNYHSSDGMLNLTDNKTTHREEVTLSLAAGTITLVSQPGASIYVNGELKGTGRWMGLLKSGNYTVECKQPFHVDSKDYISVEEGETRTVQLTLPTPITGSLSVITEPSGAQVYVDDKLYGISPVQANDLLVGPHKVTIKKDQHKTATRDVSIAEKQLSTLNVTLENTTEVAIRSSIYGTNVYVDGKSIGTAPLTWEGPVGQHKFTGKHRGYISSSKTVNTGRTTEVYLDPKEVLIKSKCMYVEGGFNVGSMMAVSANLGMYIANVNLEVDYRYCLDKSKDIFWNNNGDENSNTYYNDTQFAPDLILGGKAGYGISAGTRLQFTPQVGGMCVSIKNTSDNSSPVEKTYRFSGVVSLRCLLAISRTFGISLTPEYWFSIKDGAGIAELAEVDSKIGNWGKGFNINLNLVLTF